MFNICSLTTQRFLTLSEAVADACVPGQEVFPAVEAECKGLREAKQGKCVVHSFKALQELQATDITQSELTPLPLPFTTFLIDQHTQAV